MPYDLSDPRAIAPSRSADRVAAGPDPAAHAAPAANATKASSPAAAAARAIDAAVASLAASAVGASDAYDRIVDDELAHALAGSNRGALAAIFAAAPSPAVYRHLWRRLCTLAETPLALERGLAVQVFALPLVIVAARLDGAPATLSATLPDTAAVAGLLRSHRALGGNEVFALADALAPAHAIDVAALPALLEAARTAAGGGGGAVTVPALTVAVDASESVHLRFIVGSALVPEHARLFAAPSLAFAMPVAQLLSQQLAAPQTSVLVLPGAPAALPQALAAGRIAQREVSAQLFMSNALRRLRASVGEPTAVISSHRVGDGGGEVRVSLSSPFSPRDAEGYRCPLLPFERVADAAAMLEALLADCRVGDVRIEPGIHADRDPATGLTLLFKPPPLHADVQLPPH